MPLPKKGMYVWFVIHTCLFFFATAWSGSWGPRLTSWQLLFSAMRWHFCFVIPKQSGQIMLICTSVYKTWMNLKKLQFATVKLTVMFIFLQFSHHEPGVTHVIVTGGAGYIGSHASLRLFKDNYRVTIVRKHGSSKGSARVISAAWEATIHLCCDLGGYNPKFCFSLNWLPRQQDICWKCIWCCDALCCSCLCGWKHTGTP